MEICAEKLKAYLSSRPVRYGSEDIRSLLGLLRYQNRMFMVTTELRERYVEQAFEDGLHMGIRLCMELFT